MMTYLSRESTEEGIPKMTQGEGKVLVEKISAVKLEESEQSLTFYLKNLHIL